MQLNRAIHARAEAGAHEPESAYESAIHKIEKTVSMTAGSERRTRTAMQ